MVEGVDVASMLRFLGREVGWGSGGNEIDGLLAMVLERRGSRVKNEVSKGVLGTVSSRSLRLLPLLGAETSIKPSVPSTCI